MVNSRRHSPFVTRIAMAIVLVVPGALALDPAAGSAAMDRAADPADPPPPGAPPKPPIPPVPPVPTIPQLTTVPQVPQVPEVPGDPRELADLATPLSARLLLSAEPRRARALPVTVRLSGWLRPPMRLDRVAGFFQKTFGLDLGVCSGTVTIAFKSGGRRIASRRASVTPTCMFTSQLTVRTRRRLGPAGRLRATGRFSGNDLLGPAQHSIVLRVT
jgi:hypothetical protein